MIGFDSAEQNNIFDSFLNEGEKLSEVKMMSKNVKSNQDRLHQLLRKNYFELTKNY